MAETRATRALDAAGVAYALREFEHDPRASGYALVAAEALGVEPERLLKTLMADVDGSPVVAIVPASLRLDTRALAAAVGGKHATMADAAVAERRTGYVVGGISPFGQRHAHRVVVDDSAELWDTVLVSGGRRGLDLELSPADLIRVTDAIVADIAR